MKRTSWFCPLVQSCLLILPLAATAPSAANAPPPPDLNPKTEITSRYAFGTTPLLEPFFHSDNPGVDFPGWNEFLAEAGPNWDLMWDARSNRPNLIEGQGLPWFPGKGNNLNWKDLPSPCLAGAPPVTREMLECMALDFIGRHDDLLRMPCGELRMVETATGFLDLGRVALVNFVFFHQGVPVIGARVSFIINSGNLIHFGMRGTSEISISTQPAVDSEDAWRAVAEHLRLAGALPIRLLGPAHLAILPFVQPAQPRSDRQEPTGYGHLLAWRFVFEFKDSGLWQAAVDGSTGEILEVAEVTGTGDVTGGIRPLTARDPEQVRPLTRARVWNPPSLSKATDRGGHYDFVPGAAALRLDGETACVDDWCDGDDPLCGQDVLLTTNQAPGDLYLGISVPAGDCTIGSGGGGTGNTTAARTAFFHVDNMKQLVAGYLANPIFTPPIGSGLQSLSFLSAATEIAVNVNNPDFVCNARGDLSFYRSGTKYYPDPDDKCHPSVTCPSTGEVPGLVAHEFGHYLDTQANPIIEHIPPDPPVCYFNDVTTREAFADIVAYMQAHNACLVEGVYDRECCSNCNNCTGMRQISYPIATFTLYHECIHFGSCDPGSPLIGMERHCEGQIAAGAYYDMSRLISKALDPLTGRSRADSLFLFSMFTAREPYHVETDCTLAGVTGCGSYTWYTIFRALDDDNGNLSDGTPSACHIWRAFDEHGIACGEQPACMSGCPAPFFSSVPRATMSRQPTGVLLQWDPVAQAEEYIVFRNVLGPYAGYIPFAKVNAPTTAYVDQEAATGYPYYYTVQAVTQDYCRSRMSTALGCNYDKDSDGYYRKEYALHVVEDDYVSTTEPQISDVHDWTENTDNTKVLYRKGGLEYDDHLFLFDVVTQQVGGPRRIVPPYEAGVWVNDPIVSLEDGSTFSEIGIHDHTVVYTRVTMPSGDKDVYAHDLVTQTETPVCTVTGQQAYPKTDGQYVTWLDERHGGLDVYYSDFTTEHRITNDNNIASSPYLFIDDGTIVFQRIFEIEGSIVFAYDVETNQFISWEGGGPMIHGGRVAYERDTEIRLFDLSTLTDVALVDNPASKSAPIIFGELIAYHQTTTPTVTDVHVFDLTTSRDERITYGTEDNASYALVAAMNRTVVVEKNTTPEPTLFFIDLDESATCNGCGLGNCSDCDDADASKKPDAGPSYCSNSY